LLRLKSLNFTRRRCWQLSCPQGMHGRFNFCTDSIEGLAEVVSELHSQPVARHLAEIGAEMKVGFSRDTSSLIDDLVYALVRQLRVLSEPVRGDAERGKKLLAEEFTGVDVEVLLHGFSGSR